MGSLIATHAGLRGRPGVDITPAVVAEAVGGLAVLLDDRDLPPQIALARDERATGAQLAGQVLAAALAAGLDVVDLGVASTPAAKRFLSRHALGGAVVVTGSHLAPELNGLKLVAGEPPCGPSSGAAGGTAAAAHRDARRAAGCAGRPRRRCRRECRCRRDPRRGARARPAAGASRMPGPSCSPPSGSPPAAGRASCSTPTVTGSRSTGCPPTPCCSWPRPRCAPPSWCAAPTPHQGHGDRARNRHGRPGELHLMDAMRDTGALLAGEATVAWSGRRWRAGATASP